MKQLFTGYRPSKWRGKWEISFKSKSLVELPNSWKMRKLSFSKIVLSKIKHYMVINMVITSACFVKIDIALTSGVSMVQNEFGLLTC